MTANEFFLIGFGIVLIASGVLSAILTPLAIWDGGGIQIVRAHLRRCVVENNCPFGDDRIHRIIERGVWWADQHLGTIGLLFAIFLWEWFHLLTAIPRKMTRNLCTTIKRALREKNRA